VAWEAGVGIIFTTSLLHQCVLIVPKHYLPVMVIVTRSHVKDGPWFNHSIEENWKLIPPSVTVAKIQGSRHPRRLCGQLGEAGELASRVFPAL
jgi:hypothetical protein